MPKEHILVVEDEEDIQELIRYNLSREGYQVRCVDSGEEGLSAAHADNPDVVLLDLMLPGVDGLEVCRRLRADSSTSKTSILIISAKGEESDIVAGLELGADDYVTKPFSPRELLARIKAVLRRTKSTPADDRSMIKIHGIAIDSAEHRVTLSGKSLTLTLSEFRILELLARNPERVYTRGQIIESLRGDDYPVTDRSIDVHIVSLRRKLGATGRFIETVRGVGYRLKK